MDTRFILLTTLAILLFGLVLISPTPVIFGDEEKASISVGDESASVVMEAASLDSAFNLINQKFEVIKPLFEGACFDCHSQKTKYPWYHSLPLIGGWMDGHIRDARDEIDMTNSFPFQTHMSPAKSLAKIKAEIEEGKMPLPSYRWMHSRARFSDAERDSIFTWIEESLRLLEMQGVTLEKTGAREDQH